MNTKTRFALVITLALIAGAALVVVTWAAPMIAPTAPDSAPTMVSYQGEVHVSGLPYSGDGYFKFAVVRALGTTTYWSNDGTSVAGSEPTAAVQIPVNGGLFSVLLGDTALGGMTQPLGASVFSALNRYLRVWFSTSPGGPFEQLAPDTPVAAVPYALQAQEAENADTLDGFHASELGGGYQNVVVVAKSGTSFASVQAAIDSITDEAADNPYLVWVAPGVYEEQVTMKPYVHLQGAGQEVTGITSTSSNSDWPPTEVTLFLASDTSVRDLTLGNYGTGDTNAALLATEAMTRTLVANVTVKARGSGSKNYAIVLSGAGVTLQGVSALSENASVRNNGLIHYGGSRVVLQGGDYSGYGGEYAMGIVGFGMTTTLKADNVTALGENGSTTNYGLNCNDGMATTLHGGSFTGRGGTNTYGIANNDEGSWLDAEGVTALAEYGSYEIYGFGNWMGATANVRGGSFTGRGGTIAYGITNGASGTILYAESVFAQAEDASSDNHGIFNFAGAETTLSGGTFIGRGGVNAYGISNTDSGTDLYAESVTALCEDASTHNYAMNNDSGAGAALRGGAYTGRGGTEASGITNDYGSTLFAANVTTLGQDASSYNFGLKNFSMATVRGGAFTGWGGSNARGIYNGADSATLKAERVTALGGNGSTNYGLHNNFNATAMANSSQLIGSDDGLYQNSGSVHLGVSQLDGGATRLAGTLTCYGVYDESYATYMCP